MKAKLLSRTDRSVRVLGRSKVRFERWSKRLCRPSWKLITSKAIDAVCVWE